MKFIQIIPSTNYEHIKSKIISFNPTFHHLIHYTSSYNNTNQKEYPIMIVTFPCILYIQHTKIPILEPNTKYIVSQKKKEYVYVLSSSQSIKQIKILPSLFVFSFSFLSLDEKYKYVYGKDTPCCLILDHFQWNPTRTINMLKHVSPFQIKRLNENLPKIILICMESRKPYIQNLLNTHHLISCVELFDAVRPSVQHSKKLKKGELGCFQSHIEIMKMFQYNPDNVLILEDDIMINPYLMYQWIGDFIISFLEQIPNDWDMLYLGGCWDHCRFHQYSSNGLYKKVYSPLCSHAYIVSQKTRQLILKECNDTFEIQYDQFLKKLVHKYHWTLYAPLLNPFLQNPHLHSTIQNPFDMFVRNMLSLPFCQESVYSHFNVFWVFLLFVILLFVIFCIFQIKKYFNK